MPTQEYNKSDSQQSIKGSQSVQPGQYATVESTSPATPNTYSGADAPLSHQPLPGNEQNSSLESQTQVWVSVENSPAVKKMHSSILTLDTYNVSLSTAEGQVLINAPYTEVSIELFGTASFTLYHNGQVISVYCTKDGAHYERTLLLKFAAIGLVGGGTTLVMCFQYGLGVVPSTVAALGTGVLIGMLLNHLRNVSPASMAKGERSEINKASQLAKQMMDKGAQRNSLQLQKLSTVGHKQIREFNRYIYFSSLGMGVLFAGLWYLEIFLNHVGGTLGYISLSISFIWLAASTVFIHKKLYKKAKEINWTPYETLSNTHLTLMNNLVDSALQKTTPMAEGGGNRPSISNFAVVRKGVLVSYLQEIKAGWFNALVMIILVIPAFLLWWLVNLG